MMSVYFSTIFIVYTDDTILLGPSKEEIDNLVRLLEQTFKIEDQGELSDYQMEHWCGHNQLSYTQS
jgi:hypothetical protein